MRNQIQQLQIQGSIRIVGLGLLAIVFALLAVVNAGAARQGQETKDQQNLAIKKSTKAARPLSGSEISESRELLDQLGYWVELDAKGKDSSLSHALLAFQKI